MLAIFLGISVNKQQNSFNCILIIISGCAIHLSVEWGQYSSCQGPTHLRLFLLLSSVTTGPKVLVSLHVLWVPGRCGAKLYASSSVRCSLILVVKDGGQNLKYIHKIGIDPLHAELFWETIEVCLLFLPFLYTEKMHTVYILPFGRQGLIYPAYLIVWLLITEGTWVSAAMVLT